VDKIYVAGYLENTERMRHVRSLLQSHGFIVTSRWIDEGDDQAKRRLEVWEGKIDEDPEKFAFFARRDLADIDEARFVVFFSAGDGRMSSGGRHIEMGYALAKGYPVVIIGPRENVFQALPYFGHFDTVEDFLAESERGQ
jgi:hypothetical protein